MMTGCLHCSARRVTWVPRQKIFNKCFFFSIPKRGLADIILISIFIKVYRIPPSLYYSYFYIYKSLPNIPPRLYYSYFYIYKSLPNIPPSLYYSYFYNYKSLPYPTLAYINLISILIKVYRIPHSKQYPFASLYKPELHRGTISKFGSDVL